jgi:hypothetical protein
VQLFAAWAPSEGPAFLYDLVTDGVDVYWTSADECGHASTRVSLWHGAAHNPMDPERIASMQAHDGEGCSALCYRIALLRDEVLFAVTAQQGGAIVSTRRDGTGSRTLAENLSYPCALAVLGGTPFWSRSGAIVQRLDAQGTVHDLSPTLEVGALASDDQRLYGAAFGSVFGATLEDAGTTLSLRTYASRSGSSYDVVTTSSTHVFWIDEPPMGSSAPRNRVLMAPKAGGTPVEALEIDNPIDLAFREPYLYVLARDPNGTRFTGLVGRVEIASGGPRGPIEVLASGQEFPERIAVDEDNVYWTDSFHIARVKR